MSDLSGGKDLGLIRGTVNVIPYQASWAKAFVAMKKRLSQRIADPTIQIEHIGSTAIPEMVAKPILDILITYVQIEQFVLIKHSLLQLGCSDRGDQADRGGYLFVTERDGLVLHHIHVLPQEDKRVGNYLRLRDFLTRNPAAATSYAELKTRLAEQFPTDRQAYTTAKATSIEVYLLQAMDEHFLRETYQQARWSAEQGFDPFGALLVKDGVIKAKSIDKCIINSDPTSHAELVLISDYCRANQLIDLSGYTLYCNVEPCVMCSGAIHWAKLSRVVFGVRQAALQKVSKGKPKPSCREMINIGGKQIEVVGPMLEEEGLAVLHTHPFQSKKARHKAYYKLD